MLLEMNLLADQVPATGDISIAVDCVVACHGLLPLRAVLAALPRGRWTTLGVPLKCFRAAGASMQALRAPLVIDSRVSLQLSLRQVQLGTHADTVLACPGA